MVIGTPQRIHEIVPEREPIALPEEPELAPEPEQQPDEEPAYAPTPDHHRR